MDSGGFEGDVPAGEGRSLPGRPVFSTHDLRLRGWTKGALAHAVKTGRLLDLRRGWYADPDRLPDVPAASHLALLAAAQLSVEQRVVASHESAALVHGLWLLDEHDGAPVLSRLRERGADRPAAQDASPLVAEFPRHHLVRVKGVLCATRARTAVDLARRGDPQAGLAALDSALRRGTTRGELEEVLAFCAGWPGIVLARTLVTLADGRSESPLESVGRWDLHEGGLPAPQLQVWFGRDRVDFHFAAHRTVVEADGLAKYQADRWVPQPLVAEKARDLRLTGRFDQVVVHYGWEEARYRAADLCARVRAALVEGDIKEERRRRDRPA